MNTLLISQFIRPLSVFALVTTTGLVLAGCAMERHKMMRAPGSNETSESSTDDQGTTTSRKTNTNVSVDSNGRRRQSITSETSRDPKGWMNKTTTKKNSTTTEE